MPDTEPTQSVSTEQALADSPVLSFLYRNPPSEAKDREAYGRSLLSFQANRQKLVEFCEAEGLSNITNLQDLIAKMLEFSTRGETDVDRHYILKEMLVPMYIIGNDLLDIAQIFIGRIAYEITNGDIGEKLLLPFEDLGLQVTGPESLYSLNRQEFSRIIRRIENMEGQLKEAAEFCRYKEVLIIGILIKHFKGTNSPIY
jgi:hypothetical protein